MRPLRLIGLLLSLAIFTSPAQADPKTFLAPSWWDLSNAVAGDSKTPLSQLATTINTALTKSLLNQANGIPVLDGSSILNYPINAPSVTSTLLPSSPTYGGAASSAYRVNLFNTPANPDTSNLASVMPWQDAFVLGGTQASDKMFRMVYGQPYGGNNAAVVDAVYMNGMSAGQGTGVTAGGFGQMTTYMNYDAAARETRTGSTPPRFIASGAIKDPDGNTHTVTFSATGATFSPALPAYWGHQLRTGMNVGTNMRGVADGVIKQNNWSQPWMATGFRRTYPTYFGTMTSWATNSDGTIPSISVDGWVVFEQANFGLGNSTGKVPGKDTLDGSTPGLDTSFSNITQPAIFFGVYTKAFLEYSLCDLHTDVPYGDINNPNGTIGSQVHECDDERDLWNHDPADYVNSIHGMTYAFDNNGGGKLTLDSYGIGIAGGSALPLGIRAWNLLPGSVAYQSMANAALTQTDIFAPYAPGTNQGDTAVVQSWGMELGEKGVNTSMVRLMQYRDTALTDAMSDNETEQSKVSVHLQWKWDTTPNPLDESGAVGSQVVFNPAGYLYGLGLGAGGTFQNPKYALIIDRLANLWLPSGANISEGNGLGFIPSTGDSQGHAFFTAEDNYHVVLKDSAGGLGGLHVGTFQSDAMFTANNGLNVGQGQGLGFVPSAGDSAGHVYLHPIDNYTLELAATAGGLGQLNVGKLNAAAQIDAYGGVDIWNGQGIGMVPSTGDSQGHPFFSASDAGTVSFKTTTDGWASMLLYGITTQGGSINITGGQGLGLIPSSGDGSGHPYLTALDSAHVKVPTSAGGLAGFQIGDLSVTGTATVTSDLTVGGLVKLGSMKESDIVSLQNVPNGTLVNDTDKSTPVVYENGKWYPVALGQSIN